MEIALNKAVELPGQWWLPDDLERNVPGLLLYEPGSGIRLELNGFLRSGDKFEHIHGETEVGPVTLEDCVFAYGKNGIFGHSVARAFLGDHSTITKESRFISLAVQYSNVSAWALSSGSDQLGPDENRSQSALAGNWRVELRLEPPLLSDEGLPGRRENRPEIWIDIRPIDEEPRSLEELLHIEHRMRYFLSLIMGEPVFPTKLVAGIITNGEKHEQQSSATVSILVGFAFYPTEISESHWWRKDASFGWMWQNWPTAASRWLTKAEQFESVFHLFFAIRYNPDSYLDSQFLFLTQALEAYHRRAYGGAYMPKEKFSREVLPALKKAIPDVVKEKHRTSLKKRLEFGYEYSQRTRFKKVFRKVSKKVPVGFLAESKQLDGFADRIVNVRNDMTHFDPNSQTEKVTTPELIEMKSQLLLVLEICLLLDMVGVPENQIADLMKKRYRLN